MSKKVQITVDPETISLLSPEGVKAAVVRRIASAASKAKRTRVMRATGIFTCVLALMFVAVKAANIQAAKEQEEDVLPPIVWQGGMDPWDIPAEDMYAIMDVVMAVARGENTLTQQAIAQVVRNTCEDFDMTVPEAIEWLKMPTYQGEVSESVQSAVIAVCDGYRAVNANIHFAYNPATQDGKWHEANREFVCQIGNIRFFA